MEARVPTTTTTRGGLEGPAAAPDPGARVYRAMYPMWMWRCAVALPRPLPAESTVPAREPARPRTGAGATTPGVA